MPELPEVEVVRRGLDDHLVGRTLGGVEVLNLRAVRRHVAGPADFTALLLGRTVTAARRRGKYLWFALDDGDAVIAHLGMSGQFRVGSTVDSPHLRVRFSFHDDGPEVHFVDQRTFGGLAYSHGGAELPPEIAHIAQDPLEETFDLGAAIARLRAKNTGLKRALLDQTVVSGIGNIYADEALWRAKLHYARATATMTKSQAATVITEASIVMREALLAGGTSFDALYVSVNGESGYFDRSLNAYGQAGKPCPRCGTPIVREAFMNRSSSRCPACQPRPRNAHA
ncbi:bifunctional DNA-formamidopyrimidine glycosylase/DNA-(apurinic or apyrimidinic site) lyase [Nakamurella antarctica]|uniref:Formamidopyrimidine-DNA glycosylase n=1 Tax=Nakamurella antarctica TaxID=1902245 RepID=A0A3G8ZLP8_9ACTN|nr:bifunctional DNA-formamidopyrimidine glycosylase/DNA-(apurinic or apyrimidinic site) lyase [Nakamurella antarctica]AZI58262.1 bifunctional DNA-formamidopyrimidine glycosylase/DNA-(apurinic or apyrimidinic site) lyase [Nakamurella antarctica]